MAGHAIINRFMMPHSVSGDTWKSKWVSFIGAVIFFAGLPIGLLNLGWYFMASQEQDRQGIQTFRNLDQKLFRLKREGGDNLFIHKKMGTLFGILLETFLSSENIQAGFNEISAEKLPFITFQFFNSNGDFIPFKGQKTEYQAFLKKIFSSFKEYETTGKTNLLKQNRGIIQSFLGNIEPERVITEKGSLLRVTLVGKPGYFYWNSFEKIETGDARNTSEKEKSSENSYQGGMMAYFLEDQVPFNLALNNVIETINKTAKGEETYGIINLENPRQNYPQLDRKFVEEVFPIKPALLFEKMRSRFCRQEILPSGMLSILPLDAQQILFGIRKASARKDPDAGFLVKFLSIIILLLVANWSHKIYITREIYYISIRRKLVGLFLYATAIPVVAFLLLGYQYISDRRQVMIQDQFIKLTAFNESVDENFSVAKQTTQKFYARISKCPSLKKMDFEGFKGVVDWAKKTRLISEVYIISKDGQFLFTGEDRESYKNFASKFLPALARKVFSKKYGESPSNFKTQISDAMVDSLSDTVSQFLTEKGSKLSLASLFENTDRINEFTFGANTNLIFTTFVFSPILREDVLLFIFNMKRKLTTIYLQRIIANNARQNEDRNPVRMVYIENIGKGSIKPADYTKYPFIHEIGEKVKINQSQHNSIEEIAGEKYLVVASPMNQLVDYTLIALYPCKLIEQVLGKISIRIAFLSLVSSLFALVIGLKLSRQFLWPIKELEYGLTAIKERQFSHRIPALDHDELGDLGNTFNSFIENLEEMHVGRIVQETLFPEGMKKIGDYEIFGNSKSMSDLGGDYFDYFGIDEQRAVILVGDVTGHGVPAALLMAMAKSSISMLPFPDAINISGTLERLNRMVIETLKKKRLMTFLYSVIDTSTNIWKMGNAGHNFPLFFCKEKGSVDAIEWPGYPLGARKTPSYKEMTLSVDPGDAIILYTDGLVESKNQSGEFLGYDGLKKIVRDVAVEKLPTQAFHSAILEKFQGFIGETGAQDDVTLIVIKRLK